MLDQFLEEIPTILFTIPYVGEVDARIYLLALGIFLALTVLFWVLRMVVLTRLEVLSKKTSTDFDDVLVAVIRGIHSWVYSVVALYVALQLFDLPSWADITATAVFLVALVWQLIEALTTLVDYGTRRFIEKDEDGDGVIDPNAATASNLITLISRIVLWSLGLLFILSNLGIEVTSLLAGLGIGGLAVAFALQNVLSDLFSSFSIYLDRPFRVGDYIVIGEHSGTVEKIGVKTSRIRTLQGEELVVSNSELTTTRVQNFKKLKERRAVSTFGVLYETPRAEIENIPDYIDKIFADIENATLDRVHFTTFGDSSLDFEVVFYVNTPEYADYLDAQQTFNLKLMKVFEEKGIEFAYPTRTLYVKK